MFLRTRFLKSETALLVSLKIYLKPVFFFENGDNGKIFFKFPAVQLH